MASLPAPDLLTGVTPTTPGPSKPTYHWDGLAVWEKSTDFLKDPKFVHAYQRGMHSGHKIGRPKDSTLDIHIEWRIHILCWAADAARHLQGDFVDCGVNTGIFSLAICDYIDFNKTGKNYFLFDTYDGIPEEQISPAERALGRHLENQTMYEDCFEVAKRNFAPFPKAQLVRGVIPQSLNTVAIDKVAFLSIDLNIAEPERAALEYFWDKLVPGAPVVFDDYGWRSYHAQKAALDAFAKAHDCSIATLPTGQGLLLKPPQG
jgi:O-methyltransferase